MIAHHRLTWLNREPTYSGNHAPPEPVAEPRSKSDAAAVAGLKVDQAEAHRLGHASAIVVIGDIEVARRAVAALTSSGLSVVHLPGPSDDQLRDQLPHCTSAVAIVVRGDVAALRYALLVAHLRPGMPVVVTLFDRTVTEQLSAHLPHSIITSPATVSLPAIIDACLSPHSLEAPEQDDQLARSHSPSQRAGRRPRTMADVTIAPAPIGRLRSAAHTLLGQLRSHDRTTRMLLTGLGGLLAVLCVDAALNAALWGAPVATALYDATRVLATVGSPAHTDAGHPAPGWYHLLAAALMLLTLGFTALFTAALVSRSASTRTISMLGRRTKPRSNHVVVVGLGQVGIRLCLALRHLRIPVIAVERNPLAPNFRLAKAAGIPVLIAHGEDRQVLESLSLHRARAIAAMGSSDLDNIEIALAARAVAPNLRVVVRAGEDPVITETSPLLRIGRVIDVSSVTAQALTESIIELAQPATNALRHRGTTMDTDQNQICNDDDTECEIRCPYCCGPETD